jgi:hypothetical protein
MPDALDKKAGVIRRLKTRGYAPAGRDRFGSYLQNGSTRVYVDDIGIFVYRRQGHKGPWIRESGHTFSSIPWEQL